MNIFDFNVHLAGLTEHPADMINSEISMTVPELVSSYRQQQDTIQATLDGANIMVLSNDNTVRQSGVANLVKEIETTLRKASVTMLADFRNDDMEASIHKAAEAGVRGIKFHSYIQCIADDNFDAVRETALFAQDQGLFICIDTSYGTSKMYAYDNLKLAAFLSDCVTDVPIILLHSGGSRALEALHVAQNKENVLLETSFSLSYYHGSTVEQDLSFAYQRMGHERVIYGSDSPYVDIRESIELTLAFLKRAGFCEKDIESIMYGNAIRLLERG